MSDSDSLDYLQIGFEPASLTVPRLRSILVSHDVTYPSGAKKPQLVQIFSDEVLPQARKILSARARARRTSRGITDADSQESTVSAENDDDDDDVMPTPRAKSTRKASSRRRSEESESDVPVPRRSPIKRTASRPSSKHARASESETGTDLDRGVSKSVRKTRRSELPSPASAPPPPPPPMRVDEGHEGLGVARKRESAFTFDNPFQSGTSPPSGLSGGEKKRKSWGPKLAKTARKSMSSTSRRRTEGAQADNGIHPPTSTTFEMPMAALPGLNDVDENGVEASEEFTPEEHSELMRHRAVHGMSAVGPLRPQKAPRGMSMKGPLAVLALTLFGGYAAWYRQEKVAVGYCGVGREATPIVPAGIEVPDWLRVLAEPECEPCPPHAYCSGNFQTQCEADFVLKPHPLAVGGVVPLAPTCEPDGEKVRKVKSVADKVVAELRERRAGFECGSRADEAGLPETTVDIDAEHLKKEMSKKRRKGMGEAEFEELWTAAIGEIQDRDEVVSVADGPHLLLSSSSLAALPITCAIRRSFRLALARHRLQIASLILIVVAFFWARSRIRARSLINASVPHLVSLTLDRLATQAALHLQDPDAVPESWISIGQLRDDVLRDEHSIRKREVVWARVRKVVEMNANVRASQREGRNGVISRVWEWVGAVPTTLESGAARRRKSGRVSWGLVGEESPAVGVDGEQAAQSKWEEGRPIY